MVKLCVLFEVRTEQLNIIYTIFEFKWLIFKYVVLKCKPNLHIWCYISMKWHMNKFSSLIEYYDYTNVLKIVYHPPEVPKLL
jgi:hypothetical protein